MWQFQTKLVIDILLPLTSAPFLQPPPPQARLSFFFFHIVCVTFPSPPPSSEPLLPLGALVRFLGFTSVGTSDSAILIFNVPSSCHYPQSGMASTKKD